MALPVCMFVHVCVCFVDGYELEREAGGVEDGLGSQRTIPSLQKPERGGRRGKKNPGTR